MRLLQTQLETNSSRLEAVRDDTLIHPPTKVVGDVFYTKKLANIPEYREYFYQRQMKADKSSRNYLFKYELNNGVIVCLLCVCIEEIFAR